MARPEYFLGAPSLSVMDNLFAAKCFRHNVNIIIARLVLRLLIVMVLSLRLDTWDGRLRWVDMIYIFQFPLVPH